MEHYNRDNFERNNTGRDLYNRSSRNSSNTPKRKDFVVSFIASAIVGSALGLYYKNKVYKKTDELREKEEELRNKVLNYKEQAESTVNSVRDRVENFRNRSKDGLSSDELKAQKVAIQREVSDNNLADQSPEAQEIQEAKADAQNDDLAAQQTGPSATELAAQQTAIQQESTLADQSPKAQEIQDAKEEEKANDNLESSHIDGDKKPSPEEIAIAQTAIQQESRDNDLSNPTNKEGKKEDTHTNSQGEKLASAAQTKNEKMNNDSQVAKNTNDLTSEPSVSKSLGKEVPHLVTKDNDSKSTSNEGSFANRLASAAKTKRSKLTKGSKESQLTETLLAEPTIPKTNKNKNVPLLVSQPKNQTLNSQKSSSSKSQSEKEDKSQESAKFDKGVVTHEKSSKDVQKSNKDDKNKLANENQEIISNKKKSNTPKQNNRTQKQQNQQKVEKANSKIEKRTFND